MIINPIDTKTGKMDLGSLSKSFDAPSCVNKTCSNLVGQTCFCNGACMSTEP